MSTLQDEQSRALKAAYPTSTETSVTALLQRWKVDQGLEDWADYVTHMHAVAIFAAQPRSNFIDAQYVAWSVL